MQLGQSIESSAASARRCAISLKGYDERQFSSCQLVLGTGNRRPDLLGTEIKLAKPACALKDNQTMPLTGAARGFRADKAPPDVAKTDTGDDSPTDQRRS